MAITPRIEKETREVIYYIGASGERKPVTEMFAAHILNAYDYAEENGNEEVAEELREEIMRRLTKTS